MPGRVLAHRAGYELLASLINAKLFIKLSEKREAV